MQLNELVARFPHTVDLWPNTNAFYRALYYHHQPYGTVGSGRRISWTRSHVRLIAVRRLITKSLGEAFNPSLELNDSIEEALLTSEPIDGKFTVEVNALMSIVLHLPREVADELFPPANISRDANEGGVLVHEGRTTACVSS